jgi:hypothetical protein
MQIDLWASKKTPAELRAKVEQLNSIYRMKVDTSLPPVRYEEVHHEPSYEAPAPAPRRETPKAEAPKTETPKFRRQLLNRQFQDQRSLKLLPIALLQEVQLNRLLQLHNRLLKSQKLRK